MSRTFVIAEVGQAHDGSLGILHSYIDALAGTGVDAVKFQTHIARAESSPHEPFRVPFSYEDPTRFAYWERMEFETGQWQEIKAHCRDKGLTFISSPFSNAAVDLLESIGVDTYKIGSGEVSNLLLLDKIGRTGKNIILSSGMSSFSELDKAVDFLRPFGNSLSILQCTTQYPTRPEDIGLNLIRELQERYNLPVGLSDHSGKIYPALSAVTLGASIIEFHIVFDRRMFGPDSRSSLIIDEAKTLVEGIRYTETMREAVVDKNDLARFQDLKSIFEKSLAVNKDLPKGHRLHLEDL
ncbi:MAG: N-acetylneuraminate synthase family protein, partial [Desulfobacterales bacterium]|nr:N-acetylneuraminate synthase family protein [Desulfobacterales bacterium]